MIYENLYNNLAGIYKSKGTEKSFKNVLRCFNIDDSLIKFKSYASQTTYEVANNLRQVIAVDRSLNLNSEDNSAGVVYQRVQPGNADSRGFISGSYTTIAKHEETYGFTAESAVVFPKFLAKIEKWPRNFTEVSLFGIHTVDTGSADSLSGADTTFISDDKANFQVSAVRDFPGSKNVYFKLTSKNAPGPFPDLTSSVFSVCMTTTSGIYPFALNQQTTHFPA